MWFSNSKILCYLWHTALLYKIGFSGLTHDFYFNTFFHSERITELFCSKPNGEKRLLYSSFIISAMRSTCTTSLSSFLYRIQSTMFANVDWSRVFYYLVSYYKVALCYNIYWGRLIFWGSSYCSSRWSTAPVSLQFAKWPLSFQPISSGPSYFLKCLKSLQGSRLIDLCKNASVSNFSSLYLLRKSSCTSFSTCSFTSRQDSASVHAAHGNVKRVDKLFVERLINILVSSNRYQYCFQSCVCSDLTMCSHVNFVHFQHRFQVCHTLRFL